MPQTRLNETVNIHTTVKEEKEEMKEEKEVVERPCPGFIVKLLASVYFIYRILAFIFLQ